MWERFAKAFVLQIATAVFGFAGMVIIEAPPGHNEVLKYVFHCWVVSGALVSSMTFVPRGAGSFSVWVAKCLALTPIAYLCIMFMFDATFWIYLIWGITGVDMH